VAHELGAELLPALVQDQSFGGVGVDVEDLAVEPSARSRAGRRRPPQTWCSAIQPALSGRTFVNSDNRRRHRADNG
jgi:hypothetical protein